MGRVIFFLGAISHVRVVLPSLKIAINLSRKTISVQRLARSFVIDRQSFCYFYLRINLSLCCTFRMDKNAEFLAFLWQLSLLSWQMCLAKLTWMIVQYLCLMLKLMLLQEYLRGSTCLEHFKVSF